MFVSLKKLMREKQAPLLLDGKIDLQGKDFPGYATSDPVEFSLRAVLEGSVLHLEFDIAAELLADCARCAEPTRHLVEFECDYVLRAEDFEDTCPELPLTQDGQLDLDEFVYQELMMQAPTVILCREDCPGLCSQCGNLKQDCSCTDVPSGDPRLQVLRQLLD